MRMASPSLSARPAGFQKGMKVASTKITSQVIVIENQNDLNAFTSSLTRIFGNVTEFGVDFEWKADSKTSDNKSKRRGSTR